MLIITHKGREWKFPDYVGDDPARDIVRAYLEAEVSGSEPGGPLSARLAEFASEADIEHAAWEASRSALQAYDLAKAESDLTDGQRIVAELRKLREAVLAPRVLVRDELGEPYKAVPTMEK